MTELIARIGLVIIALIFAPALPWIVAGLAQ